VHLTNPLKAKQQTPKLVLPGEHALDRAKALLEDRRVEVPLAASLGCFTAPPIFGNIGTNWLLVSALILYRAVEQTRGAKQCRARHAEDATICFGMRILRHQEVAHNRDAEQSADDVTQGFGVRSVSAVVPQIDHRIGERL